MAKTTIKAIKDLTELEKQTVWHTIGGFINTHTSEFSNPTDMLSMHLFMHAALEELDTFRETPLDQFKMKQFAMQIFISAVQNIEVKY